MSTKTFLTPDAATFERDVLQREGTVLVDFWAPWCGPCRALKPIVEAVGSERSADDFHVAFVDLDEAPELAERFGVRSIPALKLFRGGKVVAERVGALGKRELEDWLDAHAA